MYQAMFQALKSLQTATLSARKRLGDDRIGVRVKQGRFTVVQVTEHPNGAVDEVALSRPMTMDQVINTLNGMR